jgi:hypothetical protein
MDFKGKGWKTIPVTVVFSDGIKEEKVTLDLPVEVFTSACIMADKEGIPVTEFLFRGLSNQFNDLYLDYLAGTLPSREEMKEQFKRTIEQVKELKKNDCKRQ